MLLATNISVVIVGIAMLKTDVKHQKQQFALRFRGSGARVLLQGVPAGHHHVFLSHSQKHGQDQVASLKQTLARAIERSNNIGYCILPGNDLAIEIPRLRLYLAAQSLTSTD